jgi:hypothetical protein
MQDNFLCAYYDLATSPVTFDIVKFLVLAELERRHQNCDAIHVVFVPGPNNGFRDDPFTLYDGHEKNWRLRNLVIPCCWLLPTCRQLTVCASRLEAQCLERSGNPIFPADYAVQAPTESYDYIRVDQAAQQNLIPSLCATSRALAFVQDWLETYAQGRKAVTITLRECVYEQARNSRLQEWGTFATMLNSDEYYPVLIRDTAAAFKRLPDALRGLNVMTDIAWNMELRAGLYEVSYVNLFQNNGPYILCAFNRRSRYINTTQANVQGSGATSDAHFRSQGIEPGIHQNRWSTPLQELVWQQDTADVIYSAFTQMCRQIEHYQTASLPELSAAFEEYWQQAHFHRAEWVSELAVTRFARSAQAWLMRARIMYHVKQPQDALHCVKQAIQIEESPEAFSELVKIAAGLNMTAEVERVTHYARQKFPHWQGIVEETSS